jgi:hypothetical protein
MPGSYAPILETQIGAVAYLFGITNSGSPITMTGTVSIGGETESDDLTVTWTEKRNTDTTGNTQNITQFEFMYERSIKFKPSGANRTAAAALADAVVGYVESGSSTPIILNIVTITVANYKVQALNGTWRSKPGIKLSLKMADDASVDIPCEKYLNAAQQAALTGAPIAG